MQPDGPVSIPRRGDEDCSWPPAAYGATPGVSIPRRGDEDGDRGAHHRGVVREFLSLVGAMRTAVVVAITTPPQRVSIPRRGDEDETRQVDCAPATMFLSLVGAMRTINALLKGGRLHCFYPS